jgi:UPF0716 protein FxsA
MTVFSRLFLLLTLLPLVELVVLGWIGSKTSWPAVIGLVLGTGLVGAWIVRRHGWRTMQRIQADLNAGRMPAGSMFDGLLVFVAGLLLIMPGVLSDVAAMLLLLPFTRNLVKRYLRYRFGRRMAGSFTSFRAAGPGRHDDIDIRHDQIIDVRVIESPRAADH